MFFSFNKIQMTCDHQIQRIEEKQQTAIQKTKEKKQRKLKKLEKQRLMLRSCLESNHTAAR